MGFKGFKLGRDEKNEQTPDKVGHLGFDDATRKEPSLKRSLISGVDITSGLTEEVKLYHKVRKKPVLIIPCKNRTMDPAKEEEVKIEQTEDIKRPFMTSGMEVGAKAPEGELEFGLTVPETYVDKGVRAKRYNIDPEGVKIAEDEVNYQAIKPADFGLAMMRGMGYNPDTEDDDQIAKIPQRAFGYAGLGAEHEFARDDDIMNSGSRSEEDKEEQSDSYEYVCDD